MENRIRIASIVKISNFLKERIDRIETKFFKSRLGKVELSFISIATSCKNLTFLFKNRKGTRKSGKASIR